MKKVQVTITWTVSADSSFVKNQTVQVGDAKQVLDPTTATFSFTEAENTPYTATVIASTDKNSSPPLTFAGTTPAIADILVPVPPTAPNTSFEVVDVS